MSVCLQSARGRQVTLRVRSLSEEWACRDALEEAERRWPGEGWRVLYVL